MAQNPPEETEIILPAIHSVLGTFTLIKVVLELDFAVLLTTEKDVGVPAAEAMLKSVNIKLIDTNIMFLQ